MNKADWTPEIPEGIARWLVDGGRITDRDPPRGGGALAEDPALQAGPAAAFHDRVIRLDYQGSVTQKL